MECLKGQFHDTYTVKDNALRATNCDNSIYWQYQSAISWLSTCQIVDSVFITLGLLYNHFGHSFRMKKVETTCLNGPRIHEFQNQEHEPLKSTIEQYQLPNENTEDFMEPDDVLILSSTLGGELIKLLRGIW